MVTYLDDQSESKRLGILSAYNILDTPPEADFDDLTQLAAQICETPMALISLLDAKRQWFKSAVGLAISETPRSIAFCHYTIQSDTPLIVEDARLDQRFAANPLVTREPHIRFYAGVPLVTADGHRLGTIAVIDQVPRQLTAEQITALQILSRQVMSQLEQRRSHGELLQREKYVQTVYYCQHWDFASQCGPSKRPGTAAGCGYFHV
ncbi:hypothetical protein C7271_19315 [filamentous cyanobacterium CCP5]|nr:hypothetical protein C7271_19315 [filamentous cyanobacterium CCP5]